MGACASCGGVFDNYAIVQGVRPGACRSTCSCPGCPPRPEALIYGIIQLQRKIDQQKAFGYAAQLARLRPWTHPPSLPRWRRSCPASGVEALAEHRPARPSSCRPSDCVRGRARALRDDPALRFTALARHHRRRHPAARAALRGELQPGGAVDVAARACGVKVRVAATQPHVPTVIGIWPSAGFLEREVWDLFGVVFDGPPGPAPAADARRLGRAPAAQGLPGAGRRAGEVRRADCRSPRSSSGRTWRRTAACAEGEALMADAHADLVTATLAEAAAPPRRRSPRRRGPAAAAAEAMIAALRAGGRILVCGNGGSAADAQHFAAELVGRFERERAALAGHRADDRHVDPDGAWPTTTTSTAVFARQVEALGRPGRRRPRDLDQRRVGQRAGGIRGGQGGRADDGGADRARRRASVGTAADIHVNVPAGSTARVQEVHRTLLHAVCALIERELYA